MPTLNDLTPYITPTRFSGPRGVVLSIRLLKAAPAEPTERIRDALRAMREQTVALQDTLRAQLFATPENLRPLDARLDNGWMGLREALDALARLTGTEVADRALALLPRVLPESTRFVNATYEEQWTTSQSLLTAIDEQELAPEIEALVGEAFLPFIREAHTAFGEALGLGESERAIPDDATSRDATKALAAAIAEYGRLMVGWVDLDDAESVAVFEHAMQPLDAYRASAFGSRGGGNGDENVTDAPAPTDEDVTPSDPIPPVPATDVTDQPTA